MKVLLLIILSALFLLTDSSGQAPGVVWQKCYGGSGGANAFQTIKTSDNGFIFCGGTPSNDGDVSGNHGGVDAWVVKLDSNGNIQWQKCFGGPGQELFYSITPTKDSGYIATGLTSANGGDVSGFHGGPTDFWVVKFDSNGILQWQKCLGGTGFDISKGIIATDSGYTIAGQSDSNNGDVTGNHGLLDFWITGIDLFGNIIWQKSLGGSANDNLYSFCEVNNRGFALAGSSMSNDGDLTNNKGIYDFWVAIIDSLGNLDSQRNYGGTQGEYLNSISKFSSGLIAIGSTNSNDGNIIGSHGGSEGWVLKADSMGNLKSSRCIGGSVPEGNGCILADSTGGFVLAMDAASNDGDVSGNHGAFDSWVVKLDDSLNIQWQKCFGGSSNESFSSIIQIQNGYILSGQTESNDGDVTGGGFHGIQDAWVVKLSNSTTTVLPLNTASLNITAFIFFNKLHLNFINSFSNSIPLQLFDITGRLIFEKTIETIAGKNELVLPIGEIKPGVYIVRMGNEVCKVIAH